MLTSDDIDAIIFRALAALNAERGPGEQIEATASTPLFGVDSAIDSLEFVSVITDVETTLNVDHGLSIQLADDRALSRAQSPYETAATLRNYVLELVESR